METVSADGLGAPLELLEEALRDGHPLPEAFVRRLGAEIERGNLDVITAWRGAVVVGVAVISYRLNISAGSPFAGIEDLYVRPDARRQGVGRTLLEATAERCAAREISYVEAQVKSDEAMAFYSAVGYEEENGVRVFSRSYAL